MTDTSRRRTLLLSVGAFAVKPLSAQSASATAPGGDPDGVNRPPLVNASPIANGRNPKAAEQDHAQNVADLNKLAAMVKQLKDEMENSGPFTLPTSAVKNADQIQKLAKKVHDRLRVG